MGDERRWLDMIGDKATFSRRMRILRHRAARWFSPPVRPASTGQLDDEAPARPLAAPEARRGTRPTPR